MNKNQSTTVLLLEDDKVHRYHNLVNRFIDLNDDEIRELKQLREEHVHRHETRQQEIEEIKQKIRHFKLNPHDLFGTESINQLIKDNAGKVQPEKTKIARARKKWRKSDSAPVLMELKPEGGRGRAFTYRKGRIYEGVTQDKPEPAYGVLPARLQEFGDNEQTILEKLATPEGKRYFSTQEGRTELNKIIEVVKSLKK